MVNTFSPQNAVVWSCTFDFDGMVQEYFFSSHRTRHIASNVTWRPLFLWCLLGGAIDYLPAWTA